MMMITLLFWSGLLLFLIGVIGMVGKSNLLGMVMFLEVMLNGVNLSLISAAHIHHNLDGPILAFMIFIVTASEMALAIPIILLLLKQKQSLNVDQYATLKC